MCDTNNEKEKLLGGRCTCNAIPDKCNASSDCSSRCTCCKNKKNYEEFYRDYCAGKFEAGCEQCGDNTSRVNNICAGASNILSENVKYAILVCSGLVLLFVVMGVLILLTVYIKHKGGANGTMHRRSVFCKPVTPENSSVFLLGSIDALTHKGEKFSNPKKNLFYVIDKPLTKEQACNVESVLQLLPDKLVYVIEMDNEKMHINSNGMDYITFLQKFYVNLNRIKTNKKHFFEGSLFENYWDKTDEMLSTFAAKVQAIWQFGGAALSENLLINSRTIFDKPSDMCVADKDLVYCPHECSAYTYDLMKEIINKMKSNSSSTGNIDFEQLIDDSINEICSEDVANTGCNLVYRLQKSDMCDGKSSGVCQFIRMDKLQKLDNYRETLKRFCHHIGGMLN